MFMIHNSGALLQVLDVRITQEIIYSELAFEILWMTFLEFICELTESLIWRHLRQSTLFPYLLIQNWEESCAHDSTLLSLLLGRDHFNFFFWFSSHSCKHWKSYGLIFTYYLSLGPLLHLFFPLLVEHYKLGYVRCEVCKRIVRVFVALWKYLYVKENHDFDRCSQRFPLMIVKKLWIKRSHLRMYHMIDEW